VAVPILVLAAFISLFPPHICTALPHLSSLFLSSKAAFEPPNHYKAFPDLEINKGHTIGVSNFALDGVTLWDYLQIDVNTDKNLIDVLIKPQVQPIL
jgi:hypothetical protein